MNPLHREEATFSCERGGFCFPHGEQGFIRDSIESILTQSSEGVRQERRALGEGADSQLSQQ